MTGIALALLPGCLSPLVEDDVSDEDEDSLLFPPGATVPSDPALDEQVDAHDEVERFVPLLSGFVGGEPVYFWDFGPSPRTVAPVWVFGTADAGGGLVKLENHPVLFDVVPGDTAYTPIWQVYAVFVTDRYGGEQITSPAAIEEARARGLVEAPVPVPMYVNCPVVHPDVRLEVGQGAEPLAPSVCYYKGKRCYYYDFAPALVPPEPYETYPVQHVFTLRREGREPLSEPLRNVDLNGDGDITDTNDIFVQATDSAQYSPLVRVVETVVSTDAGLIDTYRDEPLSDFRSADVLFDERDGGLRPVNPDVVAYRESGELYNMPQQVPATDEEGDDQ